MREELGQANQVDRGSTGVHDEGGFFVSFRKYRCQRELRMKVNFMSNGGGEERCGRYGLGEKRDSMGKPNKYASVGKGSGRLPIG